MLPPHRLLRPILRSGTALLLSAGLTVSGAWVTTPALATPAAASEVEADGATEAPTATLTLAPAENTLEPAQNRFEFEVRVDNLGSEAIPAGTLSLEISQQRIDTPEQLDEPFPEPGTHIADTETGAVKADSSQSSTFTVRSDEFPLTSADEAGVYLMQATLTPKGRSSEAISGEVPIVWRGPAPSTEPSADPAAEAANTASHTQLGVIIPLVLPTSVHATPSVAELDQAAPRFDALLDVAAQARATVAIDPRIIASIRAYGDDAPASAQELLRRLETMLLPSFLLQFADADPAAQAAIGLEQLLEPLNLSYLSRQGSAPAEPADETSPGDNTAGDSAQRDQQDSASSLEQLLAWPQQQQAVAWPAEGQVDNATIALLQSSSVHSTVLSSANVSLQGGPRATLGTDSTLVADTRLANSVGAALSANDEIDRRAASSTATSLLALAARGSGGSMLLAVDRGALADAEDPAALIKQLLAPSWVTPTPVASLPEGTASLRSASTLEERRELLRSAMNREADVNKVSVLLQHPDDLIGYQRNRLLNLFATRGAAPNVNFAELAQHYTERDEELRSGVQLVSTKHTQLVGTSTEVPLQLRNHLPFDAIVNANVLPISAALKVNTRVFAGVTVPADGNARVMVPVRTRVSSGETGLGVNITDAAGTFSSDLATVPLTIRSGIEKVGFWVLGVLAALLLVFGTLRSIRRRMRKRAGAEASPDVTSPDAE